MREINNQTPANGINPIQTKKAETPAIPQEPVVEKNTKEIKDLANTPAETLGRSQVAATSKDNLENDLKAFLDSKNPEDLKKVSEGIEKANKFYEITAKTVGDEKALALMKAYAEEFIG